MINETYLAQGKIDLGSSVTDWFGGILGSNSGKSMLVVMGKLVVLLLVAVLVRLILFLLEWDFQVV